MLYHKHGEKNNGRSKTVFFINQSHTEGYSYCKLSFSYITKRGEKTNKETTPNPQNAQTNQTKQNKTNRSVFCMKHFCVCNLFIMLNLVKHHKTTYVCFLTISIFGGIRAIFSSSVISLSLYF